MYIIYNKQNHFNKKNRYRVAGLLLLLIYIYIYIHTQPDKQDYCVYKKKYDNHTTTCT